MSTKGAASGVTRGCGKRKAGGIYAEVGMSPFGRPVEDFLCDPPVLIDADAYGLSAIGVKLVPHTIDGKTAFHVFDIVGAEHYPNVADFVEEARRYGISRRLARTLDFSKITDDSRLVLLHKRAYIENPEEYHKERQRKDCPKEIAEHLADRKCSCAGLWWEDVIEGNPAPVDGPSSDILGDIERYIVEDKKRRVCRIMPSFKYYAYAKPAGVEPKYSLAIFGVFPLSRLVVVADKDGGSHEPAIDAARASSLPLDIEEE